MTGLKRTKLFEETIDCEIGCSPWWAIVGCPKMSTPECRFVVHTRPREAPLPFDLPEKNHVRKKIVKTT